MLKYLYQTLMFFRKAFSRNITWLMFCMVVLGFIGSHEMRGVTSFCQFWGLDTTGYKALIHFFRVSTWSLEKVLAFWWQFVLSQNETVMSHGRAVLLGDHTCVPKDGRQMPCVVTMHQHSETQSKPSYFRGHYWGAVGMLIGSMASPFCIPLSLGIHQGLVHVNKKGQKKESNETLGTRIVQMALDFVIKHDIRSIMALDAFFPGRAVFKLAQSVWSIRHQCLLLTLVIRAKKNCVAYFEAEKPQKRGPGRPRKYGEKIKLFELFDRQTLFSNVECSIYGKIETISITSLDLLWKPTAGLIRFVLAVTKRGPIILMCSDLTQDPVAALEVYCARVRIETMFDMLKNLMGVFKYRFWTQSLERHSRKPKKNKYLKKPTTNEQVAKIRCCFAAYERFVMIGAIALGLLQLISIKYEICVWKKFRGFLRTKSRKLPSERTVKFVIADLLVRDLFSFAPGAVIREIQGYLFTPKVVEPERQRADLKPESETTVIQA